MLSSVKNSMLKPTLTLHSSKFREQGSLPLLHLAAFNGLLSNHFNYGGSTKLSVTCNALKNIFSRAGGSKPAKTEGKPRKASLPLPATVTVDNETSGEHTIIIITAENRTAMLQIITRVLKTMGVQISKANVSLDKGSVVEKIFVTNSNGDKIIDPQSLDNIQQALRDALNEPIRVLDPKARGLVIKPQSKDFNFESSDQVKARSEVLFSLMDQYLKNDVVSIQKDVLDHVEYTVASSRFNFSDFEAYQIPILRRWKVIATLSGSLGR